MIFAIPQSFLVPREGGNEFTILIFNGVLFLLIFYFILIRPGQKESKRLRDMMAGVKKGDEVVTTGGIIGTVVHAEEDRVTIKTGESTRIVVEKARLAKVFPPGEETSEK